MGFVDRVRVGAYYTDGTDLWEVEEVGSLGSVTLRDSTTGRSRFMGIDTFRRRLWLAAALSPKEPAS